MLNRIRISTTLFLILILCGVLQVGSNGLSFWAFRDGYQNLQEVETSNQQRALLAQTRGRAFAGEYCAEQGRDLNRAELSAGRYQSVNDHRAQ
jgi:hypothetical protein